MDNKTKNEIIISLNTFSKSVSKILRIKDKIYGTKSQNVVEIYRDKMYEIEDIFKSKNMPFFSDNILSEIILTYFDTILNSSCILIETIAKNLAELPDSILLAKIVMKLNEKDILEYEELCNKLSRYTLQDNLVEIIKQYYCSKEFFLYSPNSFYNSYSELKQTLINLNLNIDNLDEEIIPIITWLESQIKNMREVAKTETGSDSEEVIKEYIEGFVNQTKKEMDGKQKKHK